MAGAPHFRRKDESVEAGFRRIAVAEIEAAVAILDGDRSPAEKVHKLRRQLKALRALLRLVRPAFARFEKENRTFRDMARALSRTRDARVMLDTFDAVTQRGDGQPLPRSFKTVRAGLAAACQSPGDEAAQFAGARAALIEALDRVRHWSLSEHGWAAIAAGLARTYGDARDAMRAALDSGDAAAAHEWRKGVKYHGAQARLLRKMRSGALDADTKASSRLADLLGERHDIDMFLDAMAHAPARFGGIATVTQLAGLARLRRARIDRRAERLGERLFAQKPGRLAGRWQGWWTDWRHGDD